MNNTQNKITINPEHAFESGQQYAKIDGQNEYIVSSSIGLYQLLKDRDDILSKNETLFQSLNIEEKYNCESLLKFWQFYAANSKRLNDKMSSYNKEINNSTASVLKNNMNYFTNINMGGKRLRGTLVTLGYILTQDGQIEYSDDLALSVEFFQSAILVHDDVIDHAVTRRGKDTIQVQFCKDNSLPEEILGDNPNLLRDISNSVAISLGYLGLYWAYQKIVKSYHDNENLNQVLLAYNDIILKTIQGGMMDVILPFRERYESYFTDEEDNENKNDLFKIVEDIGYLKTACYTTVGPLCLGMILRGADKNEINIMSDILKDVGIAFQIQDDIFGVFSDKKTLGKDVGSDISEYKQTFLYAYLKETSEMLFEELKKYYGKETIDNNELKRVREIFVDSGAYKFAYDKMNRHYKNAKNKLNEITFLPDESKKLIHGFILFLECREN